MQRQRECHYPGCGHARAVNEPFCAPHLAALPEILRQHYIAAQLACQAALKNAIDAVAAHYGDPCRCVRTQTAADAAPHRGHCCFMDADDTCHPVELHRFRQRTARLAQR